MYIWLIPTFLWRKAGQMSDRLSLSWQKKWKKDRRNPRNSNIRSWKRRSWATLGLLWLDLKNYSSTSKKNCSIPICRVTGSTLSSCTFLCFAHTTTTLAAYCPFTTNLPPKPWRTSKRGKQAEIRNSGRPSSKKYISSECWSFRETEHYSCQWTP